MVAIKDKSNRSSVRWFFFLVTLSLLISGCEKNKSSVEILPPKLTNNPSFDITATNFLPLLSFFVSKGGTSPISYTIELDTDETFQSEHLIRYEGVQAVNKFVAEKRLETPLQDKSRNYWRVKAVDSAGRESRWSTSRFYVDTEYNKKFMNLVRVPIASVSVSSGRNKFNIIDLDDPGQESFWQATPPGPIQDSVLFDFGKTQVISRIWMLSNIHSDDGWLEDFYWEISENGKDFKRVPGGKVEGNDTHMNTIDIPPVRARYMRLKIKQHRGTATQLNALIFYSPGMPSIPKAPEGGYVLLVGDQMSGATYTQLAGFIEKLDLGVQTLSIPHYEVSLEMLNNLNRKPLAILFSGNDANYVNLPMYEYNGLFEIIREGDVPILGICAGHQMLAFCYGFTFCRSMGWADLTALEKRSQIEPIYIVKENPIFKNMNNPFIAPEVHEWCVAVIPEGFELLAKSSYIQAIRSKEKFIYGEQFHSEIEVPYNGGENYLINFLNMAIEKTKQSDAL